MRLIARKALRTVLARLRRLPGSEEGFTMVAALGVMTLTSVLVTAAFVAAQGDINLTQRDLDNKRAYFAARGGVDEFLYHLKQNPNYWSNCPKVNPPVQLPGSTPGDGLTYGYVPVPANGASACVNNNASTMIDDVSGTFRMRFTGTSRDSSRSIVASFRRDSPLDFLWYTVYEVLDPNTQSDPAAYRTQCEKFHREGRDEGCDIQFISGDFLKGPMFTQDQFATCGTPSFGRDSSDEIKSMGNPVSYASCAGTPGGLGTRRPNAGLVDLPPANTALRDDAVANDGSGTALYAGPTRIQFLGGNTAQVTNAAKGWTDQVVNLPPIIYVEANPLVGCSDPPYTPYNVTYSLSGGCGNVYVSGQYSQPMTIAATNDIIIEGNVTASSLNGPAMLGLVAKNFVRVMHSNSCAGAGEELPNPTRIHAAILALQHSFIVDNYNCGGPLGTLEIRGAIAQNFRGTVGTHSGSTVTNGYVKDYEYDDRLATRMPPYLFDLNEASWHIDRQTICVLGGSDTATQC